eukprot:scaffold89636_cov20-Tisochrysis_lutea.AAC.1
MTGPVHEPLNLSGEDCATACAVSWVRADAFMGTSCMWSGKKHGKGMDQERLGNGSNWLAPCQACWTSSIALMTRWKTFKRCESCTGEAIGNTGCKQMRCI